MSTTSTIVLAGMTSSVSPVGSRMSFRSRAFIQTSICYSLLAGPRWTARPARQGRRECLRSVPGSQRTPASLLDRQLLWQSVLVALVVGVLLGPLLLLLGRPVFLTRIVR